MSFLDDPSLKAVRFGAFVLQVLSIVLVAAHLGGAVPKPDYGVQHGDSGDHDHHHDHHHHHDQHDHHDEAGPPAPPPAPGPPAPPPPPPAPTAVPAKNHHGKKCKLVRESSPKGPLCFNEPECKNECKQVPQQQCSPVQERECHTRQVQSCNIIQEEKCQTNYITQVYFFLLSKHIRAHQINNSQ